jgi:ABC-type nitrate/sulfonate/bicarbonate transport system ATPase subunit
LRLFESEEELQKELQNFITAHKSRLGLVSLVAPLISNLAIWSNIALIRQYHENMPRHGAKALAEDLLRRLGMTSIAEKRNPALTTEERFCAMLLRASMVRDAILVLDRPFSILTNLRDGHFIMETLRKVDDLIAETHIFDYSWEKGCYGGEDDAES